MYHPDLTIKNAQLNFALYLKTDTQGYGYT